MFKNLALACLLLPFCSFKSSPVTNSNGDPNTDTSKVASIKITPPKPLIEKDIYGYYLNFDIVIKNQSKHTVLLNSIEIAVMDPGGKLVERKVMDRNTAQPGINVVGNTVIKPGETLSIFNPFHTFTPDVTIASLKYGFFFYYQDNQQETDKNRRRLPMDYDASVITNITPQVYVAKNEYHLPLKGKIIVWDGHDFLSDNRRGETVDAKTTGKAANTKAANGKEIEGKTLEIPANSNRYAYDLMSIDGSGSMYGGSPFKKENWYVFGKPVYVPSDGKVVEVETTIPDNEFDGKEMKRPKLDPNQDPKGMGNYIIIAHNNGEYSVMQYLEQGSIRVRPGEMVKAGQEIGTVGFSGDAIYPRLHYTVINKPTELAAEGIPSYFNDYKLYRGNVILPVKRSRIDSGDIVESDNR